MSLKSSNCGLTYEGCLSVLHDFSPLTRNFQSNHIFKFSLLRLTSTDRKMNAYISDALLTNNISFKLSFYSASDLKFQYCSVLMNFFMSLLVIRAKSGTPFEMVCRIEEYSQIHRNHKHIEIPLTSCFDCILSFDAKTAKNLFLYFFPFRTPVLGLRPSTSRNTFWRNHVQWWKCIQVVVHAKESRNCSTDRSCYKAGRID